MGHKPLLHVHNVTKRYKKTTVVHEFQLTAQKGELIGLYGPNGAGKSTIIKMISGIVSPTSGTITVNGLTRKANRRQYAQYVSYMPDHFQFRQPLTVMEFLMFYARLRHVSKSDVLAAIDKVGLTEKQHDYVSTLSKGMGQRLLLAQVLFSGSSLILLDEPTNGLDDEWLMNLQRLLRQLKVENKTVLFSTHLYSFANDVSDRVIRIERTKK
ncbi:ABC transporter ATP-binding protein [Pueribacillus sp. YX66]|uniref:ABC transporter ATP-binding protein n=1 Tax=Pueribacillus sp. YX66 TaxID=3229242 RepID=UPI00358D5C83